MGMGGLGFGWWGLARRHQFAMLMGSARSQARYRSLDALRGIAALVVVIDHSMMTLPMWSDVVLHGVHNSTLTTILGLTAGERAERDQLAGMAFRSITDGGLSWALVRDSRWLLDGVTSVAVNHEHPVVGPDRNDPIGVLQALSKIVLGPAADTTQRFTYYPDFKESAAYRAEAEVTAQAAMNSRLALKIGYLWRRSNAPGAAFQKDDSTATASVVVRWKAATAAP